MPKMLLTQPLLFQRQKQVMTKFLTHIKHSTLLQAELKTTQQLGQVFQ
jgi:hypothetical protein